jgi:cytochrome c553
MRRLLKVLGYLVALVLIAVLAAVAFVYVSTNRRIARTYEVTPRSLEVPAGDAAIERGRFLAHRVSLCVECHGADLGGKLIADVPKSAVWGTNLTRGRGGIGGAYSDADFVRALMHGVRKDGRSVVFMPSQDYQFTKADMAALIAYLRTLPPVDREIPPPQLSFLARALGAAGFFPLLSAEYVDHAAVDFAPEADRSTDAAAGDYVISTAACRGCHGPALDGVGGPPGVSNLTPVGIGAWTETDFTRAIREARRPNGTEILPTMPRVYKELPDDQIRQIFAYLKTLKPSGEKGRNQG